LISPERRASSFALGLSYETKSVSALQAYGYHVIDCRDTDLDLYKKIDLIGTPPGSDESQFIQVKAPTNNKGLLVEYTAVNGKAGWVRSHATHLMKWLSELRAYVEQLPQQVKSCYAGQADYGQWYQRPNRKDQCVQLSHTALRQHCFVLSHVYGRSL
jgi:hypothetical protein